MKAKQKPGVVFQPRVHHHLQRGIHQLVGAIRPTLGPLSGGVAIDHLNKSKALPEYLDNGGTIARRIIELASRDEDIGAMLVRSMILRQQERIGDGTATVAVLFEAIFNAGLRYITAGGNAMQVRRHLEALLPKVLDALDRQVFPINGRKALAEMAFALCHEREMAEYLGEAFDVMGEFGRIAVREDYGHQVRREYVQGSYYHTGLFSRLLANEDSTARLTFENPSVFVCDFEVKEHTELFPVLAAANRANVNGLVIVTRSLSEKAISLLVAHNRMDKFKVMAVKLPGFNPTERMAALDDLSVLTGATPHYAVVGNSLESISEKDFGKARRVWADHRAFGIIGGQGDPRRIRHHLRNLRTYHHEHTETFTSDERKASQERIGTLLGGAFTIWVGGFTEPQIAVRKDRAERAVLTMRTALQGGVVSGGGVALLNVAAMLKKCCVGVIDPNERAAYMILIEALAAPARTIFANAGYDPSEIMAKLRHEAANVGFDVLRGQMVEMPTAGIIDSAIVVKTCVRNAISTASLALTIDSFVHLAKPEIVARPE